MAKNFNRILLYTLALSLTFFSMNVSASTFEGDKGNKDKEPKKLEITGEPLTKKEIKSYRKLADYLFENGKPFDSKDYYLSLYNNDNTDIHSAYRIAEAYRMVRYYTDALYYYEICLREATTVDYPLMRYWAGMMLMATEDYDRANEFFNLFLNSYEGEDSYFKDRAIDMVKACDIAPEYIYNPIDAEIVNVGEKINKSESDNGAFMKDEYMMVFAGTDILPGLEKVKVKGGGVGSYDSLPTVRLFQTILRNDEWSEREMIYIPIDELNYHVGAPTFNDDRSVLFFTFSMEGKSTIYQSVMGDDGDWGKPEKIRGLGSSSSKYPSYYMDEMGREFLFFSSNLEDGFGGYDIYYTEFINNEAIEIKNLGEQINTKEDEVTPFYMKSDSTLFFSSNGHLGLGELDIFRIKGEPNTGWAEKVENVGYPINTGTDDYYYSQFDGEDGKKIGFISSNRPGGNAIKQGTWSDDIYTYTWQEYIQTVINVNFFVLKDGSNKPLVGVQVQVFDADADTLVGSVITSDDGKVDIALAGDMHYKVMASKKSFMTKTGNLSTFDLKNGDDQDANFSLIEIVLPIIYFEFDRSYVNTKEKVKLDELAALLKELPNTKLEVNAHTDSKGSNAYNLMLSERRAKSVIDYLIKTGIDRARLEGTWEGEMRPMVTNDVEEGRKHNRRAEFELFGKDGESIQRSGIIDFVLKTEDGQEIAKTTIDDGSDPTPAGSGEIDYDAEYRAFKKMLKEYGDKENAKLEFKVQIGAYFDPGQERFKALSSYNNIQVERKDEKIYRFVVGELSTIKQAEALRQKMISEGIKDAFICPYSNGKRIRMVDAIEYLK